MKRFPATLALLLALAPLGSPDVHRPGEDIAVSLCLVNETTGAVITGETPTWKLYRVSDGYYYDFTQATFLASGWTDPTGDLDEIGTTGTYLDTVDSSGWTPGEYLAILTNTGDNATAGCLALTLREEPSSGLGSVAVTQDYPTTDNLKPTDSGGAPIEDVQIRVYLTSDYDAGHLSASYVKGMTTTDVNGDWETPIYLDPADYSVVFAKSGKKTKVTEVTVEAE